MAHDETTLPVPSVSIEALLMQREAMMERARLAQSTLRELLDLAHAATIDCYGIDLEFRHTRRDFLADDGLETMRGTIDAGIWKLLLDKSGLRTFLDATKRKEWDEAIRNRKVPEATLANIQATFSNLYASRGEMFERGVVELFKALSWDYKTNRGTGGMPIKFGKRLVLTYMVERWGHDGSTYGVKHEAANKLDDLLRVMFVLDGKPELDHRQATYHTLNADGVRWMRDGGATVAEVHGMFEVKGFKNGNAHLTFKRPDLVDKMNLIIAKHYPNALPPEAK